MSDYDSEEDYDSECCSESSFYELVKQRKPFAQLSVMIQMEYADGWTLKDYIENSAKNEEGLKR